MAIVPAGPTCTLFLDEEELRAIRDGLAEYVQRADLTQKRKDAAWTVLGEIAPRIRSMSNGSDEDG